MTLRFGRSSLIWEWPTGRMAWFMWSKRQMLTGRLMYRVGPVTWVQG